MTPSPTHLVCPQCAEAIKPGWRICPVCETRLQALTCPKCGGEVREHWRRCPECETLLVCSQCGRRLKQGESACPDCASGRDTTHDWPKTCKETVCGMELVLVTGGDFNMGDTLEKGVDNEQPVHAVTLDDYYIMPYPVTQAQWSVLMADNPSAFPAPRNPVEQITWNDAREFAAKLTQASRQDGTFLLPTEAQWEYAARSGGRDDLYCGGDDINALAWYDANSRARSHSVGRKAPNRLGLYDMSGNVWEWCRDTFQANAYDHHSRHNPFVELPGPDRVIRGGSWNLDAWSARCARRTGFRADFIGPGLGFRLVMIPGAGFTGK